MTRDELQVIDRTYQLLKWFLKRLEKFPRSHRYGLGRQIEERLYAVFDRLMRAKYAVATDKCKALTGVRRMQRWPRPAHAAIAPAGALRNHVQVLGQSALGCARLGRQTNE